MARNWERSEAISVGVRPAERRRSKPRGAGMVFVFMAVGVDVSFPSPLPSRSSTPRGVTFRSVSGGRRGLLDVARRNSAASSACERGSAMEQ